METLVELFEHVIRSNPPDRELLRARAGREWRSYTTSRFGEAVRQTAGRLAAAGVAPGDRVALFSENRPEWHIVDFACHLCGAALVPLYPSLPASTVAYIVKDAGARLLIVSGRERAATAPEAAKDLPDVRLLGLDPGLGLEPLNDLPVPPAVPAHRPAADDLASLIYTSGTTGEPKGVMLSHRNFAVQINTLLPLYPITNRDEVMSFLPLPHVFQRILDYIFLAAGCRITYVEAVEKVVPMLPLVRPTIMGSVPRVYERAYVQIMSRVQKEDRLRRLFTWAMRIGQIVRSAQREGRHPPIGAALQYALAKRLVFRKILERFGGRLRFTISGGAPLAKEIGEFFDIVGLPLLNGYGLTESAPVIAVNRLESNRIGSVGPAAPGVEIRIADDGEILARGPNIMLGYWNKPEATAQAVDAQGWLHTGDIGYLDRDGFLYITDRKKDIIVTSGGKNVAPQPIEARLAASAYIAQALVIGDNYPYITALLTPNFEVLAAYFTAHGINGKSREEIASHPVTESLIAAAIKEVNAELAPYERIRRFTVLPQEFTLERGELTPSLKVRRKIVTERYRQQIEEMYLKTHRTAGYGLDE
ncbi:MAG: long-chain fatty acid--CoA ligase [Armatimonadota bacterium]|nr:long-chain fatty acid--CoA ligase [Armatimonadota bacterium]MDR7451738.1 long-chain fatty acid--CoA ligase [Armatimonadota bacterium]MDR7467363.1 long-chain fatty acid--CoA ligase [Armatimonadota bacterium]MDR7494133.1 long-chain fatty acid--CoA ligase [Armatimonadota bacterium]MDR7498901.1 long-chain fatty acid--CoA ligase [Armatimonadota bacterium]